MLSCRHQRTRPESLAAKGLELLMLRPGDGLLSIIGSIGGVDITSDDVPAGGGKEIWTAGQALANPPRRPEAWMMPVALRELPAVDPVQEHLQSLAAGGSISRC